MAQRHKNPKLTDAEIAALLADRISARLAQETQHDITMSVESHDPDHEARVRRIADNEVVAKLISSAVRTVRMIDLYFEAYGLAPVYLQVSRQSPNHVANIYIHHNEPNRRVH